MTSGMRDTLVVAYGAQLRRYALDADAGRLDEVSRIDMPDVVQYAWPHARGHCLYVISTDGRPPRVPGSHHTLSCVRMTDDGQMSLLGDEVPLPHRALHVTTDAHCKHVLVAYNVPSTVTVHRLDTDGTIGAQVEQDPSLDFGIYAHQVRVTDSGVVMVVARGNDAHEGPEDPGAILLFELHDGRLVPKGRMAPDDGYGFGPRHLDLHPQKPWVYASLERQNELRVYGRAGNSLGAAHLFARTTLANPSSIVPRQMAGTLHVHPNGRFVYVANRVLTNRRHGDKPIPVGGESGIAVFAINGATGEPTKIQDVATPGTQPRTFAIDSTGRLMAVAHQWPWLQVGTTGLTSTPPNLSLYRIGDDGRLSYLRQYDFADSDAFLWWVGIWPAG